MYTPGFPVRRGVRDWAVSIPSWIHETHQAQRYLLLSEYCMRLICDIWISHYRENMYRSEKGFVMLVRFTEGNEGDPCFTVAVCHRGDKDEVMEGGGEVRGFLLRKLLLLTGSPTQLPLFESEPSFTRNSTNSAWSLVFFCVFKKAELIPHK